MATKADKEFIKDAQTENANFKKKNTPPEKSEIEEIEDLLNPGKDKEPESEKIINGSGAAANDEKAQATNPNPEPVDSEFKQKFDEYFKGAGSMIAGETVVGIIDDFKTNLLWMYAKKNNLDIPKSALQLDPKAKQFASFLVDHGIKNKAFGWVEKNPLLAATAVVGIGGLSSYFMIEMLKKGNTETEKLRKENERLKAEAEAKTNDIIKKTISDLEEIKEEIVTETKTD